MATLSAAILRMVAEVGYATLTWLDSGPVSAAAELDQHVAAIRADLSRCQHRPAKRPAVGGLTCPDVPFAGTALRTEAAVPVPLLLHYACGFMEAAVRGDWWPGDIANGSIDWECMRLAALCKLISQAEAAEEMHPDLSNFA